MGEHRLQKRELDVSSAVLFIVFLGIVSLFSDMTYEGGRSLVGQFLKILGARAAAVGIAAGAGELFGYGIRLFSGLVSDRTGKYWTITILGYAVQLFALPALAFVSRWEIAVVLMFIERMGKGIRTPSRDAMLSYATSKTGRGFGFGLHEAMDQIGAFLGPLVLSFILLFRNKAGTGRATGYSAAFMVLFIPAVLAIIVIIIARSRFPNPRDLEGKTVKVEKRGFRSAYWWYLAAAALVAAGYADFPLIAFHLIRIELFQDSLIPTFYAMAMAVDALSALGFGRLYDRIGLLSLVLASGVSAIFAPFVYLGGSISVILGLALWGVGLGAQESIMRAAVADLIPEHRRGAAYGLFHTGYGILWFLGSAAIGLLYEWHVFAVVGYSVLLQLCAIPLFLRAHTLRSNQARSSNTTESP
jgi:MFS family permease